MSWWHSPGGRRGANGPDWRRCRTRQVGVLSSPAGRCWWRTRDRIAGTEPSPLRRKAPFQQLPQDGGEPYRPPPAPSGTLADYTSIGRVDSPPRWGSPALNGVTGAVPVRLPLPYYRRPVEGAPAAAGACHRRLGPVVPVRTRIGARGSPGRLPQSGVGSAAARPRYAM